MQQLQEGAMKYDNDARESELWVVWGSAMQGRSAGEGEWEHDGGRWGGPAGAASRFWCAAEYGTLRCILYTIHRIL